MWIYILIAILVVLFIYVFILYNSLVRLNNMVKEAFSTMDVYLKKRWDLVPNIVEVVKGYATHENNTFQEIAKLRSGSYENMSYEDKLKTNEKIAKDIASIMIVAENYPELKSNQNFQELSEQLVKIEEDIANARKYYNGVIKMFNNQVEMFPNNIFARMFGYRSKNMFEAEKEARDNVEVDFKKE